LIPDNSDADCYSMIPRIGAFEITHQGIVVFSKLLSQMWPHYEATANRIKEMLQDQRNGMPFSSL
jgi:hypothetical protein